jgi:excisionase family DNA binding protein
MPSIVTTAEIAAAYRVTDNTIYRYRRDGKLPYIKLPGRGYRYRRADVFRIFGEI